MGKYDTYYRTPILAGTGIDNVGAADEGMVVLTQQQTRGDSPTNPFSGAADVFFQLPPFVRLKEIYLDFAPQPGAGTYSIGLGTGASTAATPLVLAGSTSVSTTSPRNLVGYSNPDPAAWALITNSGTSGVAPAPVIPNTFLRVSLAGITVATRVSVFISYAVLPTP